MKKYYTINDNSLDFKLSKGDIGEGLDDSKFGDSLKIEDNATKDYVVYNILTTSDKKINSRKYPDANVKKTVLDNAWTKPFPRPVLTNHDDWSKPEGRVTNAYYVKHNNYDVSGGNGELLPDEVISHFAGSDCF